MVRLPRLENGRLALLLTFLVALIAVSPLWIMLLLSEPRWAWLLLFSAVGPIVGWVVGGESRLRSARGRARAAIENLREELSLARAGEGENYAWTKGMPYRPAFTELLANNQRLMQDHQLKAQSLEREMEKRWFWQPLGRLTQAWDCIEFECERSIQGMSDGVYWSGMAGSLALKYGLQGDQSKEPRLRLVINNKTGNGKPN